MKKIISYYNPPISNLLPFDSKSLFELFEIVKKDSYLREITELYRSNEIDNKFKSDFKKLEFPYITLSGIFNKRNDRDLISYSNLICIDCDDLTTKELIILRELAESDKYVVFGFTSPSEGYKIIIRSTSLELHPNIFNAFRIYLSQVTGIPIKKFDSSCSNISRACFICHDSNAYLNRLVSRNRENEIPIIDWQKYCDSPTNQNEKFENEKTEVKINLPNDLNEYPLNYENKDLESNFKILIGIMENKRGAYESPREPWIQGLAAYCNQFGMSEGKSLEFMLKYFSQHPKSLNPSKPIDIEKYIVAPVKDTYVRYANQFGIWIDNNETELEIETPSLPDKIFDNIPNFLKVCNIHKNKKERDVVFLTSLVILSACFPNYYGVYDKMEVCSNLFLFIAAPPSSGKGVAMPPRLLGRSIQKKLDDNYNVELCEYNIRLEQYKKSVKEDKDASKPVKPERKTLFIPANNTSSKLISSLQRNKKFGIIMDTEADTLTHALKSEWGNFSDSLRKVFHHECIELERKLNDEFIRIEKPCLSLVLTGTPGQIDSLLNNVENGLLSRFGFYIFSLELKWKNVFEIGELPEEYYSAMSVDLLSFIDKIKAFDNLESDERTNDIKFMLNLNQQKIFNEWFEEKQQQLFNIYGNDIVSSVRRLGLITFRIAMILSIIRKMEVDNVGSEIICKDEDFDNSIEIVNCLLYHTIKIFTQLKNLKKTKKSKKPEIIFFEKLPTEFNWSKAKEIASFLNIKSKTAENYVAKYIQREILIRVEHGQYRKQ